MARSETGVGDDHHHDVVRQAFASLDVAAIQADLVEVMHTSQDWWPEDTWLGDERSSAGARLELEGRSPTSPRA